MSELFLCSLRYTIFAYAMLGALALALFVLLVIFPIFYFTTGRKFDAILGKKTNIEFLAFSNMQSITFGRHAYYAMVLANKKRREMKLTHDIFDDFDFLQHATAWDIRISKLFIGMAIAMGICLVIGMGFFAPDLWLDFKTWVHSTF
jgi:hypothetical protein